MFENILKKQLKQYPEQQPQDVYKMIYQGVYAGGHIIKDKASHLTWLIQEMEAVKDRDFKRPECISNAYMRLHLDGLKKSPIHRDTLEKMILLSAEKNQGSLAQFEERLSLWQALVNREDTHEFIARMKAQNYPLVHHSEAYRQAYHPAYRIIDFLYGFYFVVFEKIDALINHQGHVVIAIDGDAGSGKSTLARLLASIYPSSIIPMDHFFLRNEQRTEDRLHEVGGHIDYERFLTDVIIPLKEHRAISYRPYRCQIHHYEDTIQVLENVVTIIEGSYSLHPSFGDYCDISVFLNVEDKVQLTTIEARDGKYVLSRFIKEWIPKEKDYAKTFKIAEKADFTFDTTVIFNQSINSRLL